MSDAETDDPRVLLRQQTTLAKFGELALRSGDLDTILTEACRLVGDALGTDLSKVMQLLPDGRTLLVRAGVGWNPGVVGEATVRVADDTSEAHALKTKQPLISPDIAAETRFRYPAFLTDHGVRAVANVVVIGGNDQPAFGVLQVDSRTPRQFTNGDTAFLRSYANLIAAAVDRLRVVGELREGEARLRASVERQQAALETGLIGFFEWDVPAGTITADRHFAGLHRLDPAAAEIGVPLVDLLLLIEPEDRATVKTSFEAAVASCGDCVTEFRIPHGGDATRWISVRGHCAARDNEARPLRYVGTAVDVSVTKAANAALRASERRLRELNADLEQQVIERSLERGRMWQVNPDLMGVCNRDGYFEISNPAWQTVLGWSASELQATKFFDLLHPDDLDRTRATFEAIKAGTPALRFENRYRCKDGGYRWVSWVAVQEGEKSYCSARDITTEKAQAEALAERTAERDRVWRNSRDLLLILDTDGIFRAVNPAWTVILGYTPEELLGRSVFAFIWPDDIVLTQGGLATGASHTDLTDFENRYRHKDGTIRWISWHTTTEGSLIYAYGRDVTAQKEAQAELAQAQEALRQSQKMEAVGQLTGGLAHDFNNLLAGISGSLELLQARVAQGRIGDLSRYLSAAQGAAKRAAALTHRLLAFSRRQTLDPKPTDANRLIAGMEDLIRRTVGPEITVEVVAAGGLWITLVDPNQLENALLNLCINARDSMPEGGQLTIETGNKWLDARAARERDLTPGQYVSVCVSDTGSGMAPEIIQRAFDPFYTTKPIGMGTGLGLSMVYGFARQSDGHARIYSEVGQGTMVCLYLPRHHGAAEEANEAADLAEAPRAEQGETVLVVDDEPTVRMLVTEVLGDLGYTAIEAADGSAGLRWLQSDVRIDLLVTDVGLPGGMNGRQMADAARERRPGLRVLFITGYAENAVVSHGHLSPGMHVMTKPFAMEALASRIKALIAGT